MRPLTEHHPGQLAGIRVLVVEDDDDGRELLTLMLTLFGAEVTAVASARAALAAIEASPPRVVVSDISMPGEDGYWLAARLRERPVAGAPGLPAIAVSGVTHDRRAVLAAGFHAFLPKPVDPITLVRAIRQVT